MSDMPTRLRVEDGSSWPHPEAASDIEHVLRYGRDRLTESERLTLAGIVSAYHQLVTRPDMVRKPAMIRRAIRARYREQGHE